MFHGTLFALLSGMFLLFAFSAAGAGNIVLAVAAGLMALWTSDAAFRSVRGTLRRRRATRTDSSTDGRS